MKELTKNLDFKELLKKMKIIKVNFIRGLGIIENRFELLFEGDNEGVCIEIEINFRIRNQNEVLLSYNDLYLDINRKEMSVKKYRSQTDIEKSYLHKQLEVVNTMLFNAKPRNVYLKSYGDLYISFYRKGIVLEILNDTHLENACLFRVIYKTDKITYSYECIVKNNKLVFSGINF
ncbi:MAG: hypothetical protein MRZ09_07280 [Coprobacillus sp.]|nr:hypothetical protein [Coprobacillus sp.]